MSWRDPADAHRLGAWAFDLRDDEIADLTFGGRRVLRSIRAVVRDRNWDTASLIVDGIAVDTDTLRLTVRTVDLGADLRGSIVVSATVDTLTVAMDLTCHGGFDTNRTGLVVLHPPQTAGAALAVEHADGTHENTSFPVAISPHQPVVDIRGLGWRDDGVDIDVAFAGDVFEMEDQRNWTDASYKTYSRPLALPFPYRVGDGERVTQSITVTARITADQTRRPDPGRLHLTPSGHLPAIGLGAATAPDPAPDEVTTMGSVRLVELDLATPTWPAALQRATAAGLPLDVRLVLDPTDPRVPAVAADALRSLPVARVGVFTQSGDAAHVSDADSVASLRAALAAARVDVPVVGGARSHFTELNRERHRLPPDLDALAIATTPLFHSLSTDQLEESVAMQRLVAEQTVQYAAGLPVHIGPICLRPRFNNVATVAPPAPNRADLADGYGAEFTEADDERLGAPEAAAWTVASAAALAVSGVASLTYFEEWGPRGIFTASGAPRPVAAALAALADLAGQTALRGDSPNGLVWALGALTGEGAEVLVANLDVVARAITVVIEDRETSVDVAAGGWERITMARG